MATPSVADLGALLGRDLSGAAQTAQATQVIAIVTSMAKAHTRWRAGLTGNGFDADGNPVDEVRATILTASARLLSNARGLLYDETVGPESISYRSAFTGWTLMERMCLDRWRVKAI